MSTIDAGSILRSSASSAQGIRNGLEQRQISGNSGAMVLKL
jgi:hypothetical protein